MIYMIQRLEYDLAPIEIHQIVSTAARQFEYTLHMANELRWLAIVILIFFQRPVLPCHCKTLMAIARKGIREQDMVAAKHFIERLEEHSTHETRNEIDSVDDRRSMRQLEIHKTEKENEGSRRSFRKINVEGVFNSKRLVPGGPNARRNWNTGL